MSKAQTVIDKEVSILKCIFGNMVIQAGSSLVRSIEPNDYDIVIYTKDTKKINKEFTEKEQKIKTQDDCDSKFLSIRRGKFNYLIVEDFKTFHTWALANRCISAMQPKERRDRVLIYNIIEYIFKGE